MNRCQLLRCASNVKGAGRRLKGREEHASENGDELHVVVLERMNKWVRGFVSWC